MKPKNKLQRQTVALSKELRHLSSTEKSWAENNVFDKHYVQIRKTTFCLECGNEWKNEGTLAGTLLGEDCSKCGCKLKKVEGYDGGHTDAVYWSIVTTYKGVQVVRTILSKKYMKKRQKPEITHYEVMQHWIYEDGKSVSLLRQTNGMSFQTDSWIYWSDLEVRTMSERVQWLCSISPLFIYSRVKVLDKVKRNGFDGRFFELAPNDVISALLSNPKMETLVKANQIQMFRFHIQAQNALDALWGSIKICIRNNYTIQRPQLWIDYIRMLEALGNDTRNAHFVCVDDLTKAHNKALSRLARKREQERMAEKRAKALKYESQYRQMRERFFDLMFKVDDIEIVPITSVYQLMEEATRLHHCAFDSNYHLKEDSLLMSARKNGEPVETIEFNLKRMKVVQSRGLQNKFTEYHSLIVDTVHKNVNKIARLVA